ncbi:C-myc promoter-binding protein-like [Dendronephthya gigantea]|uniref:C-myc promoter-binding protein-like n=1 Tax=Dendronephthya gigantea TaxID=151771 RepID=UPI001068EA87|nr:C-myc promoter-binding protein-like [Dendronephthya gigantea]XP_028399037.1 C-myc promoter-binding protein-like [Dendronephthya gigantea]
MDDNEKPHRVADYFVVTGLSRHAERNLDGDGTRFDPITDVTVIFKSKGEVPPEGFTCVEKTPTGYTADLNSGSLRSDSCFLCYRRGRDKPPIVDIGVLYEGKERLIAGCDILDTTPQGHSANISDSSSNRIFITYRRSSAKVTHTSLAVTHINVINTSKGEQTPHAFCLIQKNLNKGMVSSDVFLCYRKSPARPHCITYEAEILSRYPKEDLAGFPLPPKVPNFSLPMGAIVECWPRKSPHPLPIFSTFILTRQEGQKVYGAGVTFFEELPEDQVTEEMKKCLNISTNDKDLGDLRQIVHSNKCIALLSHWPFFEAFKKFLSSLYRISVSTQPIPLERYISHFMLNVPFPSPQRPRILVQMNLYEPFEICQPYLRSLPVSGASFSALLRWLGPENSIKLFYYALTEHKLLIHSLRAALLTSVSEALVSIIFPFSWQCPFVPLCPVALSDILNAPCPFIVGIDSRYFELCDPPDDVICVDLDTNMISPIYDKTPFSWKLFPKKPGKALLDKLQIQYAKLHQLCRGEEGTGSDNAIELAPLEHDSSHAKKRLNIEVAIQEAFLRFNITILKGYRSYLKPITEAPKNMMDLSQESLFDLQGFLKSRPSSFHKFLQIITKTQLFCRFIEQRSFVSSQDPYLEFYDECSERADNDQPLIEIDDVTSNRTYVVTPLAPNDHDPQKQYSYPTFPELQDELFITETSQSVPQVVSSPVSVYGKRTPKERHESVKSVKKIEKNPSLWSSCLLAYCYSIWFIHLPAYVRSHHNKAKALLNAYEILCKMQKGKVQLPDEVCYRILMKLCGQYDHPALAVKAYYEMKRNGFEPNAVTYGYYMKAVFEGKWPSTSTSFQRWRRMFHFISAVNYMLKFKERKRPIEIKTYLFDETERSNSEFFPGNFKESNDSGIDDLEPSPGRFRADSGVSSKSSSQTDLSDVFGGKVDLTRSLSTNSTDSSQYQVFINADDISGDLGTEGYQNTTSSIDFVDWRSHCGMVPRDVSFEALICSCNQCKNCEKYIYDEEIMAGWTSDDSNLNTSCPYCATNQAVSLTIKIKDYRNCSSRDGSNFSSTPSSYSSSDFLPTVDTPSASNPSLPIPNIARRIIQDESPGLASSFSPPGATKPVNIRPRNRYPSSAPCSAHNSPGTGLMQASPKPRRLGITRSNSIPGIGSQSSLYAIPEERDVISVNYVSPLVLRKELENLMDNEGVGALESPDIIREKQVIFWNMAWYFRRLNLPTHLTDHIYGNYGDDDPFDRPKDFDGQVIVSTSWDSERPNDNDHIPLYVLWNVPAHEHQDATIDERSWTPRSVVQSVVAHIKRNDIANPFGFLFEERNRQKLINPNIQWSIYREMLFLSLMACGSDNIVIDSFDKEYRRTYRYLHRDGINSVHPFTNEDHPLATRAMFCRRAFKPPTLQPRLPPSQYFLSQGLINDD